MSTVNVKLGNNTYNGVDTIKLQDATTPATYHDFTLGGATLRKVVYGDSDATGEVAQYSVLAGIGLSSCIVADNNILYGTQWLYGGSYGLEGVPYISGVVPYINTKDIYFALTPSNYEGGTLIFPENNLIIYIIDGDEYQNVTGSIRFTGSVQKLTGTEPYIVQAITLSSTEYATLFNYAKHTSTQVYMSLNSLLAAHNINLQFNGKIMLGTNVENVGS